MPTTLQALMDSGVDPNDIYVLTKEGLAELTREIFKNVNARIEERIITALGEGSDNDHVPSALTVFNALKKTSNIKSLVIANGDITAAQVAPDPNTLYVVRTSDTATSGTLYAYVTGTGYVNVSGGTTVDAGDVDINAISSSDILSIVSSTYAETDPGIDDD